jgi:hypothetical protein
MLLREAHMPGGEESAPIKILKVKHDQTVQTRTHYIMHPR